MSEIHKFMFEGLPVRGAVVRLTEAWVEILRRRASNSQHGAYPPAVQALLGEMTAAAVLMQSNIKFNGALIMQVLGDGPVKLAVVEVQSDFSLRATASLHGAIDLNAGLSQLVNVSNQGRCAITLDPQQRHPGQQPYQGVVPLLGNAGEKLEQFSDVLQHYMRQSEQLDTTLVLAANEQVAAGLLIQRLPSSGTANLAGTAQPSQAEQIGSNEHYQRLAMLASSLKREELLTLELETVLHRLFWDEPLLRFAPQPDAAVPHFACTCSRERVAKMINSLGADEAAGILQEQGRIEVGCDFCALQYRFDPVDVAQLFRQPDQLPPASSAVQ